MPNKYVFNNVLKNNNTLSSFAIDPTTKLFDNMNNFFKMMTTVARVYQYWNEYSRICIT